MADKRKTQQTVDLAFPFTWEGQTISQVTIFRPKMKTLRKIEREAKAEIADAEKDKHISDWEAAVAIAVNAAVEAVDANEDAERAARLAVAEAVQSHRAQPVVLDETDDYEDSVKMIEYLSDLPKGSTDEMDLEDFTMLSEKIGDFFPAGVVPATGDTSSPKQPTG